MLTSRTTRRFGLLFAPIAALLSVVVLICVPALTRVGQKLETASRAPSFSRNIDTPPKRITVPAVQTVVPTTPVTADEVAAPARFALAPDTTLPRAPFLATPRPLRAPPSTILS